MNITLFILIHLLGIYGTQCLLLANKSKSESPANPVKPCKVSSHHCNLGPDLWVFRIHPIPCRLQKAQEAFLFRREGLVHRWKGLQQPILQLMCTELLPCSPASTSSLFTIFAHVLRMLVSASTEDGDVRGPEHGLTDLRRFPLDSKAKKGLEQAGLV